MRVLLHAWGSRGDVQPVLALALCLRERGHRPAIAAMLDFREWITGHGIEFEPIDAHLDQLSHTPAVRRYLGGQASSPGEDLRALRDFLTPAAPAIAQTLVRTHQAYEAIVTNPITLEATPSLPPPPPGWPARCCNPAWPRLMRARRCSLHARAPPSSIVSSCRRRHQGPGYGAARRPSARPRAAHAGLNQAPRIADHVAADWAMP